MRNSFYPQRQESRGRWKDTWKIKPSCKGCGKPLSSIVSVTGQYGNNKKRPQVCPTVGYCGMCARKIRESLRLKR